MKFTCKKCGTVNAVKNPISQSGGRVGGKAKGRKGFAVASQPTAESRKIGWEKRRAKSAIKKS